MFHNLIMFNVVKNEKEFCIFLSKCIRIEILHYARETFHYFDLECTLKLQISCELFYFSRLIMNRKVLNNSKLTLIKNEYEILNK